MNLNKNRFQFDYFSENYKKFEEDFYKYSNINIPLTFLTDDIMKYMISTEHEYFKLSGKYSKDLREHYFIFMKTPLKENENISQYKYIGCK